MRKLEIQRGEEKKEEQKNAFEEFKEKNKDQIDTYKLYRKFQEESKEKEIKEQDECLWRNFSEGEESGNYQLVAVITHKGRSTDSGHYVGWCQDQGDSWVKFDDDQTSKVTLEEVMALRGGGDWHMAYLLIYRRLQFK